MGSGPSRSRSVLSALLADPQVRPEAMVIMSEFSAVPSGTGQGQQKPLRVGFYDVERTLGKGNFAVVKLARHRVTKTQVRARVVCVCGGGTKPGGGSSQGVAPCADSVLWS